MKKGLISLIAIVLSLGIAGIANAVIIDFTGGTAYLVAGGTVITNNTSTAATAWGATDYYEENGFKLDFIGDGGIIGDYYGGGNDVIHGHWLGGGFGTLTEIKVSKLDNSLFDLNYFEMTSNTVTGGGPASGSEKAYITAYNAGGVAIGSPVLLPSDDWGWTGLNPQVFLGSDFDNVAWFSFSVIPPVACFGMDMFYINEPGPPPNNPIPEPGSMMLLGTGLLGMIGYGKVRFGKKA